MATVADPDDQPALDLRDGAPGRMLRTAFGETLPTSTTPPPPPSSSLVLPYGALTGKRIERQSSSGVRPGYELRPSIVVTVKFEGITRDSAGKRLSLRDPKLVMIRSDKAATEADTSRSIEELYLRQRVG